ncbi:hypothetical protein I9X38_02645 [Bacillus mojavensis]|nr:hypothetical protein I9X38_02645 [Bacillus mojavensis]
MQGEDLQQIARQLAASNINVSGLCRAICLGSSPCNSLRQGAMAPIPRPAQASIMAGSGVL